MKNLKTENAIDQKPVHFHFSTDSRRLNFDNLKELAYRVFSVEKPVQPNQSGDDKNQKNEN